MPPRSPSLGILQSIAPAPPCPKCYAQSQCAARLFSTASARSASRARIQMWQWMNDEGKAFKEPTGSPNYLAGSFGRHQPFRLNYSFRSEPVLSEEFREVIWERVMKQEMSVAQVSRDLSVEMSRVAAVVRLKELEKNWESQGKKLAKTYAKSVMSMLPQTEYSDGSDPEGSFKHESINDLPVHKATTPQIFYPTSESRVFTRANAAKVFDPTLLPADERIPHPEMIEMARDRMAGLSSAERAKRSKEREEAQQQRQAEKRQKALEREEKSLTRVQTPRWEFRFKEISVDDIGADGRGARATGHRYGAPHMDRKRGHVKIPTSVI